MAVFSETVIFNAPGSVKGKLINIAEWSGNSCKETKGITNFKFSVYI